MMMRSLPISTLHTPQHPSLAANPFTSIGTALTTTTLLCEATTRMSRSADLPPRQIQPKNQRRHPQRRREQLDQIRSKISRRRRRQQLLPILTTRTSQQGSLLQISLLLQRRKKIIHHLLLHHHSTKNCSPDSRNGSLRKSEEKVNACESKAMETVSLGSRC